MHIRGVNFPASLIRAQKERRLVIFAGAGISIPHPSSYPNFGIKLRAGRGCKHGLKLLTIGGGTAWHPLALALQKCSMLIAASG
jgi:hypothetical protein